MSRSTVYLPLLQDAKKRNSKYLYNVRKGLEDLSKGLLASLAANALHHALDKTVQDSSRFAANWDLSLSAGSARRRFDPHQYGQTGESYGTIGTRGSRRGPSGVSPYKEALFTKKAAYYGYTEAGAGQHVTVIAGGRIHSALGVGKPGASPTVYLYNPIIALDKKYTANALGGQEVFISPGLNQRIAYEIGKQHVGFALTKLYRELKKL